MGRTGTSSACGLCTRSTESGVRVTIAKSRMVGGELGSPDADAVMLGVAYGGESITGLAN